MLPAQEDKEQKEEPQVEGDASAQRRSGRKRHAPQKFQPDAAAKKAKTKPNQKAKKEPQPSVSGKPAKNTTRHTSKTKRGLRGQSAVDTTAPLGVVDPASNSDGVIVTDRSSPGAPVVYDVMLVLFSKALRHDKFIVLQLIEEQNPKGFLLYERWGRTGTSGMSLSTSFGQGKLQHALSAFHDKFKLKTGLPFDLRDTAPIKGKYRMVKQNFQVKAEAFASEHARWQYWVGDGVDGKANGWYEYDESGTTLAEQLYMEFQNNPWLTERIVASGQWSYLVNLLSMTQTNIVHPNHTCRHIRRVAPGENPDDYDPTDDFPGTTTNAIAPSVLPLNVKAKKPNVLPVTTKPAHKVEPAPHASTSDAAPAKTSMKKEPAQEPATAQDVQVIIPVDTMCPNAERYVVFGDFDATLNQTNIMKGNNNNKYYRIQLLQHKKTKRFLLWTRWGRVGEARSTQTKLQSCNGQEGCEQAFEKKFSDKTGNLWDNRDNFVPRKKKYEMLEMDYTTKKEEDVKPLIMSLKSKEENVEYLPSCLPDETRDLIEMLFEEDVYIDALREFEIDVNKMPLGALSTDQIQKGVAVLEELEQALKASGNQRAKLERLSSQFYTTIPRDFGRTRPPVISNPDMLQKCYDMCNVLLDMEKATDMMSKAADTVKEEKEDPQKLPHPTEAQYASLNAELKHIPRDSEEYDVVAKAFDKTKGQYESAKLLDVWRVERMGEKARFEQVSHHNNYLLWHGSHIAAISAILATGLRIMPHSGGRVGRGIYLASENGKSQSYTTPECRRKVGCMFLAEAALGKIAEIIKDDPSLKRPPSGFDSVRACGRQTPGGFKEVQFDDRHVKLPVEQPVDNPKAKDSSFRQDEYLIYNEAQARIRYVITVKKG